MKKFASLCLISALVLASGGVRAETKKGSAEPALSAGTGTVLKDNVNLRTRADKNSEVLAQLKKGEVVEVKERKGEWLRIVAPGKAKCYVSAKFVKGGAVTGDAINVRCGPGTNYRDIGKLNRGDKVQVTETKGEWSQIKPTASCFGWVAADLIEVSVATPAPAPITTTEKAPPPPPAPIPAPIIVPAPTPMAVPEKPKDVQTMHVVKDGYLAVETDAKAPAKYALMTADEMGRQYVIAYIESTKTNLQRYEGRHVRIVGNLQWKQGERDPVIVVERCDPMW